MDKKLIQVFISLPLVLVQVEVKDPMALFQDHKRLISCPNSLFQDHQRPLHQDPYTQIYVIAINKGTNLSAYHCYSLFNLFAAVYSSVAAKNVKSEEECLVVYIVKPIRIGMQQEKKKKNKV